jgi:hypothetical protein
MDFTPEQQDRFVDYLMDCHSWYKHIPLMAGGAFYIVIDENAGQSYPTKHPRLPFGNDQENYVKAFGLLEFYRCLSWDDHFHCNSHRETFSHTQLKEKFPKHVFVRLFPYMSPGFNEESLYAHKEDYKMILDGIAHEEPELLKSFYKVADEMIDLWQNKLTDLDREDAMQGPDELEDALQYLNELKKKDHDQEHYKNELDDINKLKQKIETADPLLKRYWSTERELRTLGFELRSLEKSKIIKAISLL